MERVDDAELYRKHAEELVRLATVLVGPHDAEDVVAAAVLRTLSSPGWSEVRDRRAYWVRAVCNEARSLHRSRVRRAAREERTASREEPVWEESSVEVLSALGALSVRQRAVVFLTYWEDLPVEEVAALLGVSDGSARRHLARARAKLRRLLA